MCDCERRPRSWKPWGLGLGVEASGSRVHGGFNTDKGHLLKGPDNKQHTRTVGKVYWRTVNYRHLRKKQNQENTVNPPGCFLTGISHNCTWISAPPDIY